MSQDLGRVTGLSAYEVWKKQPGNSEKTEEDFLTSLKGERGEQGVPGERGQQGVPGEKGEQGERGATGATGKNGQTPQISMRIDERGHLLADITYQ